jgi:crossover junction endodeoxyribonuclease RuvC
MEKNKRIIIGIDPGSRFTGYGIICIEGQQQNAVAFGTIATPQTALNEKLYFIYQHLCELITLHKPDEAAIEQIFTCLNMQSALKLGQARGAALTATAALALPIVEYSARQIKKAVTGYGAADKMQIQHMVRALLRLTETPKEDAADALAIAICHANHRRFQNAVEREKI